MTSWVTWGDFGNILGYFGALWGHFWDTLGSLWPYRRRWARVMRIVSPCVRSKRVHKREIHIFPTFFNTFTNHGCPQESPKLPESDGFWGHSRFILGSCGSLGMTFTSLWVYEGCFDLILVAFQRILIFPTDFNDFI